MNAYAWLGTKDPIVLGASLLACIFGLGVAIFNPFPNLFVEIAIGGLCAFILFRMIYLQFYPVEDEIELAVLRLSYSAGLMIGLSLFAVFLTAIEQVPAFFEYIFQLNQGFIEKVGDLDSLAAAEQGFRYGIFLGFGIVVLLIVFSAMVVSVVKAHQISEGHDK